MRYRGSNIRLLKSPNLEDVRTVLTQMQEHGANAVAFNTFHYVYLAPGTVEVALPPRSWGGPNWYIFPDVGQDPDHPFRDTTPVPLVRECCAMARQMGYERVTLKPMIDPYFRGGWRGVVSVGEHAGEFAWAYRHRFLEQYLPMVQELNLDLCFGTELVTVTKECSAYFWVDVARWLRNRGIKQRLTYAANWGWWNPGDQSEFRRLYPLWDSGLVDYIGIDMYAPMVPADYTGPLTVDLLIRGAWQGIGWYRTQDGAEHWMRPLYEDVLTLKAETCIPLWFTEIGYGATPFAAVDPAGDREYKGPPVYDQATPLIQAARQRWSEVAEGMLWWEAGYGTAGVPSSTHNLLGSPLADIAWKE